MNKSEVRETIGKLAGLLREVRAAGEQQAPPEALEKLRGAEIGRASCRERV